MEMRYFCRKEAKHVLRQDLGQYAESLRRGRPPYCTRRHSHACRAVRMPNQGAHQEWDQLGSASAEVEEAEGKAVCPSDPDRGSQKSMGLAITTCPPTPSTGSRI